MLPLASFHLHRNRYNSYCVKCEAEYGKEWRERHRRGELLRSKPGRPRKAPTDGYAYVKLRMSEDAAYREKQREKNRIRCNNYYHKCVERAKVDPVFAEKWKATRRRYNQNYQRKLKEK